MGKYGGLNLYMYITPTGCRIIEGANRSGALVVEKFFTVKGIESYFEKSHKDSSLYEVTNIAALVSDIVTECENRNVRARKVFIMSNCFGITTTVSSEQPKGDLKSFLFADLDSKKKKDKKSDTETKNKQTPGQIQSKTVWGEVIIDGVVNKYTTTTIGDKYLLKSLVHEFYYQGYDVVAISNTVGQLFNLRQTEAATFDSSGKIIFDVDSKINIIIMVKDIPVDVYSQQIGGQSTDIAQKLLTIIKSKLSITNRNPKIYLAGEYFTKFRTLDSVIRTLTKNGYAVFDIFERPLSLDDEVSPAEPNTAVNAADVGSIRENFSVEEPISLDDAIESLEKESKSSEQAQTEEADEVEEVTEESTELTPDYTACFAALMSPYMKQVVNVVPPIGMSEVFKKNSTTVARGILIASALVFVVSAGVAGFRFFKTVQMKSNPSQIGTYTSRIQELQMNKTTLDETMQTLTQADMTVLNVISFVNSNNDPAVKVISIDTTDMLMDSVEITGNDVATTNTQDVVVSETPTNTAAENSTDSAQQNNTISGSVGGSASASREPIVIRGYSKTGAAALDFYDRLFKYGLSVDPVLNGVEKYELPDGQEVYIFEIQVGGEE